jgi:hypothetical protein
MTDSGLLLFLLFAAANSFFCYRAGERAGKWAGVVNTFQFLKIEKCLKDTASVAAYNTWPNHLQKLYTNPEELI